MKFLIPGGAGYIGSHMVNYLLDSGHEVVVLDNFSTGNRWAIEDCEILELDLLDEEKLSATLKGKWFDAVIHFAAKSLVGESVADPHMYYKNNVVGSLNLIRAMLENDMDNLVFSSTAAVFGNPQSDLIKEDHPVLPINPYGQSKLFVEKILADMSSANGFNSVCLRYFNACGADPSGKIGEGHNPETHLIPNVLRSLLDAGGELKVFGNNYPTRDGTCIRDYIHVNDLASAHFAGLLWNRKNPGAHQFNLGNGAGFSILEVINACESVTGQKIKYSVEAPREGDPATLVSDSSKAKEELNWVPEFAEIEDIVESAWQWHSSDFYCSLSL